MKSSAKVSYSKEFDEAKEAKLLFYKGKAGKWSLRAPRWRYLKE